MTDKDTIRAVAKVISKDLKNAGLFGSDEGKWTIFTVEKPKTILFVDSGEVNDFVGVYFKKNDDTKDGLKYFYPPPELNYIHDNNYSDNQGFWVNNDVKVITTNRMVQSDNIEIPKSSSELRKWSTQRIIAGLLRGIGNYESILACIISQLEETGIENASIHIKKLTDVLNTVAHDQDTSKESPKAKGKSTKGKTTATRKTSKSPKRTTKSKGSIKEDLGPKSRKSNRRTSKSPSPKSKARSKSKSPSPKSKSKKVIDNKKSKKKSKSPSPTRKTSKKRSSSGSSRSKKSFGNIIVNRRSLKKICKNIKRTC